MNKLNSQVVELLEGELGFVLGEAERRAETCDPQHPVAVVELITQIKGTCAMVGLDSRRHLADEFARTLTKESLAKVVDPQQLKELVHQSLVSARKLARAVIDTRTDNVCALLPEMTALRRLRGEPPLYEYHCLTQVNWPALDSAVATNPLGGEQQDDVRRLLHLYQFGLLDVIRDNNRNKAFVILFRVCKRIEDIAVLEAEKNYWWIVSLVIRALAEKRLELRLLSRSRYGCLQPSIPVLVAVPIRKGCGEHLSVWWLCWSRSTRRSDREGRILVFPSWALAREILPISENISSMMARARGKYFAPSRS